MGMIGAGRFGYSPYGPLAFYRPEGASVDLEGFYRGRACALVCGGPSLATADLSLLRRRGLLTMAINQAWAVFRPHLWTAIDNPGLFIDQGWLDPGILKLVPENVAYRPLRRRRDDGTFEPLDARPVDCPGVLVYLRGGNFTAGDFLERRTVIVGCESKAACEDGYTGRRTTFMAALRLLYHLGVRDVLLVGADFRMDEARPYGFDQARTAAQVRSTNGGFKIDNARLARLRPLFEAAEFNVVNCTPGSGLAVFPYVPLEEAVERACAECARPIVTAGWSDPATKEAAPCPSPSPAPSATPPTPRPCAPTSTRPSPT